MAALTAAQIELANSLTQDELPTKLRCAICSKLAINAFRLPCCETAICENCQSTLPASCPVCEHSPVSGTDCTIYKSLRTTIRVFLKTEERKRESARPKPANESAPSTPVQVTPTPTQAEAPTVPPKESAVTQDGDATSHSVAPEDAYATTVFNSESTNAQEQSNDTQLPQESLPEDRRQSESLEGEDPKALVLSGQEGEGTAPTEDAVEIIEIQDDAAGEQTAQPSVGPMNGNFMSFSGDMNQMPMPMMMAMQNGMNPAPFGSFPMMAGMGMGMNPMMMQDMFMNGGFGAHGMNGMGMNMGMNGFGGGSNNWNGQQSWNVGQDNFNPNAPSMGNGDFGNFNTGFRNHGHQTHFNEFRRGNFGFRGRGRVRNFHGTYSRGGYYHQGPNSTHAGWAEHMTFSRGNDSQPTFNGNEAANNQGTESKAVKEVDEFGRTIRPGSGQDVQALEMAQGDGHDAVEGHDNLVSHEKSASADVQSGEAHNDLANGNDDVSSAGQPSIPKGPASLIGRQSPMVEAPINAPTGPKAMRQGLPNTSFHRLKARGLINEDKGPSSGANAQAVASPLGDPAESRSSSLHSQKDLDRHHREHGPDRDLGEKSKGRRRDRSGSHSKSKSRSPSRSRSRDRKESRRHRRHRSESLSDDGYGDEYRGRKHKNRRKSARDEDYSSRSKDDKYAPASRSPSPDEREHKRSGHRSYRDRDEKRRDRDKDKERESDLDRHRKSGHRSHRDRDRDRDRDYDRERDREREKDRDHERRKERRERDKERHHRSGKSSATPLTPIDPSDKAFNPPTGPRGSFSIKGASNKPGSETEVKGASSKTPNPSKNDNEPSRRSSQSSAAGQKPVPTGPAKDPHTLERETRDRERLLKEAQRIAGLAGLAGKKRARDEGEDRGSRRKSRRSEAVNTDEEESRMRRLEAEREGRRWE